MNKVKSFLHFLQLTDKDKNLSLTNIALIVVVAKIAISPFDYAGVAVLLPVIASYMQRRATTAAVAKEEARATAEALKVNAEQTKQLDYVNHQLAVLSDKVSSIESKQSSDAKVIDEARSMFNGKKLMNTPRQQL